MQLSEFSHWASIHKREKFLRSSCSQEQLLQNREAGYIISAIGRPMKICVNSAPAVHELLHEQFTNTSAHEYFAIAGSVFLQRLPSLALRALAITECCSFLRLRKSLGMYVIIKLYVYMLLNFTSQSIYFLRKQLLSASCLNIFHIDLMVQTLQTFGQTIRPHNSYCCMRDA